MLYYSHLFIYL